ncbi:polysaccharide deacetylase family protein [Aurantimonas sp. DM33-3]|uniref:polysaccharide deacetylase family protein n=1 Tax=Aurantimonas sp. DM33-3 TaxID=2766955 RepID=UPI0016526B76|nr:polysaccharide deacetylase family protein [Aurantimonas sp. DM33-3]MBC6715560.1 polysaccharide deacetylase family protein [Aurantimonas sp. DM33-3]
MPQKAIESLNILASTFPVSRFVDQRYGGKGFAVMLHRLVESASDQFYQDICLETRSMRRALSYCRRKSICIVTMDEALKRLADEDDQRRFVVFTFDDGYRDNLTHALPIFEAFEAPFSVYVTSGMIDRTMNYWWEGLKVLVRRFESIDFEPLDQRLQAYRFSEKRYALRVMTRWVEEDVLQRQNLLAHLFVRYGIATTALLDEHALTIEELRTISRSPLVTIGGHTESHRPLSGLDEESAEAEIRGNRNFLIDATEQEVAHFSYPHGDLDSCGPREAAIVKNTGYHSGISTRKGCLFPAHALAPFLMPRGTLNPNRHPVLDLAAQKRGAHRWLASRGGEPIQADTLAVSV